MEAELIAAPGDGLGPAVLLTLGVRLKAQYLFNIPDGFSRFVLEHKIRPGLGLRAAFLSDLLSATGMSGLIMRLRGEGHGQLELFGPLGTLPFVSSLRHFVHWRHPAVMVSQMQPPVTSQPTKEQQRNIESESEEIYSDDHITVMPLWDGRINTTRAWKVPTWLENVDINFQAAAVAADVTQRANLKTSQSSDSSESESTTSSESSTDSEEDNSPKSNTSSGSETSTSRGGDDGSMSTSSSSSDEDSPPVKSNGKDTGMFDALDAAFMSSKPSGGVRTHALGLMQPTSQTQGGIRGSSSSAAAGRAPLLPPPSIAILEDKDKVRGDVGAHHGQARFFSRCGTLAISLWKRDGTENKPSTGAAGDKSAAAPSILGFLCRIRASNQVLVVANCHSLEQFQQLRAHPAALAIAKNIPLERQVFTYMLTLKVAGWVLMLGPGLARQPQASSCLSTFPGPVFCMEYPGPGASNGLGYISSARTTARLSMVSQKVFPLPAPLRIAKPPPPPPPGSPPRSQSAQQSNNTTNKIASLSDAALVAPAVQSDTSSSASIIHVKSLTKVVWQEGTPVLKPKDMGGPSQGLQNSEGSKTGLEAGAAGDKALAGHEGAIAPSVVDVAQLQADLHQADPELKLKLERLAPYLPRADLPRQGPSIGTAQAQGNGTTGTASTSSRIKRERPESEPNATTAGGNNNNKRAAAELQARLRGGTIVAARQPPPPPGPPPPPPLAQPPPPTQPYPVYNNSFNNNLNYSLNTPSNSNNYGQSIDPVVTFLGTGSAEPSQHRGASAIHLSLGPGRPGILLDCGEGSWGQLVRLHGPQGASHVVRSLAGIWISHRHADHMAGVLQILAQYPVNAPPLLLVGPRSLKDWLEEAAPVVGLEARYTFAHCSEVENPQHWSHMALTGALSLSYIASVPVRHCGDAFGIVIRHQTGWSLVYSGDTQPSEALVRAGAGATLLIHEATFEPALEGEARKKRHSTSVEAIDVARRMGAYRTILTHFSQRYPKFPEGIEVDMGVNGSVVGSGVGSSVSVAFDGMCVPLSLLEQLPAVTVAVKAVLEAAEAEKEQRANMIVQ